MPHEFFVNAQDNLPSAVPRPDEDIRELGPSGVFCTHLPREGLYFGQVIAEFEDQHRDPAGRVHLSDLLVKCCEFTGVAFGTLPVVSKASIALRNEQRAEYKKRKKEEANAAPSTAPAALEDDDLLASGSDGAASDGAVVDGAADALGYVE